MTGGRSGKEKTALLRHRKATTRNEKLEALGLAVWERCADYTIVENRVVTLAVEIFGPLPFDKA